MKIFDVGDRVRISLDYYDFELQGVFGIITMPPNSVRNSTGPWQGHFRREFLQNGDEELVYWVAELDTPRSVGSIDAAEIPASALTRSM